jgi:hypothetical protein
MPDATICHNPKAAHSSYSGCGSIQLNTDSDFGLRSDTMASPSLRQFQSIADPSAGADSRNRAAAEEEAIALLGEVHDLLRAYAPAWYSQELEERIERVLQNRC